jgi:hypothetical protein
MPAGRHGHKIREIQRRIDRVLEKERERRRPLTPPPPPISEEHAALRKKIVEEWKAIEWDYSQCAHTNDGRPLPTPEGLHHAHNATQLMDEEEKLLAEHGVDYRPYQTYDFS